MIQPPLSRERSTKPSLSIWHRDIGDLLSRGGAKVPADELAVLNNKLAFLLGAGITIKEALPIVITQTKGRLLRQALPNVHNKIMQGEGLAQAMGSVKVFPVFMCGFIGIGEMTAQLPQVCGQLADYYEWQAQTKNEMAAALLYPAMVTLMMLGVIIMAVVAVLPGYAQVFDTSDVALPAVTRGLLRLSAFVAGYGLHVGLGLCAVTAFIIIFMRNEKGKNIISVIKLRFALFRQGENLRLVQALSLMLNAGQSVSHSIPVCAEVTGNVKIKRDLQGVHAGLAAGRSFWVALGDLPYIDPLLVSLARVGEETGCLPKTIGQCQKKFAENYRKTLLKLNKLIEPVITLSLGLVLALVMIAVVLPTFEMATAV
jgi:type II secretory pathway component PulF